MCTLPQNYKVNALLAHTIHHNHHRSSFPSSKTGCLAKVGSMTTCVLLFAVVPPHCFRVLFSQASSSTRKARSCTGSNEPFSHIDQPLPDPISPWTCSAIEAACPFIPPTHTPSPSIHPLLSLLLASPASIQPCSRSTCVHHGDKAERGTERKRERASLSIIWAVVALSFASPCVSPAAAAAGAAQTLARCEPQ